MEAHEAAVAKAFFTYPLCPREGRGVGGHVTSVARILFTYQVGPRGFRRVGGHEAAVVSVSFSPDSAYLASGCSGGELKLWDARYGHALPLAIRAEAHDLGVSALHFSPAVGQEGGGTHNKNDKNL